MTNQETQRKNKRRLKGIVVSDKMEKTVLVRVDRTVVHPLYGKRYVQSKKYQAHDEENVFKIGDKVTIVEDRPRSRHKTWRVVKL